MVAWTERRSIGGQIVEARMGRGRERGQSLLPGTPRMNCEDWKMPYPETCRRYESCFACGEDDCTWDGEALVE